MLTTEYAFEEIRKLDHTIKTLQSSTMNTHQKAYVEHLESLRTAYEKELEKAKLRRPVEEVDALDYIRRYFPRDGSII